MGRAKESYLKPIVPPNKQELEKLYLEDKWSTRKCAEHFGMSQSYIRNYMKEYGIPIRSISENGGHSVPRTDEWKAKISAGLKANNAMRGKTYELHPGYKTGKRSYRNRLTRDEVLLPFCRKCSSMEKLVVHHIDHDRDNNDIENLMVLCASCHKQHHVEYNKTQKGN